MGCGRIGFDASASPASPDGPPLDGSFVQRAYVKASNTGAGDHFGFNVAVSGDGSRLAISAEAEDSAAVGVNGAQADNTAFDAGAVYVFVSSGGTWTQEAYLKASNTEAGDLFGVRIALSSSGDTLAVGAVNEDSASPGINGNQADNSEMNSGAVYVFTRTGTTWSQQAYVKPAVVDPGDAFGSEVALSADGSTLAVAAVYEGGATTGIGGDAANNSAPLAGAAYVFTRSGTLWSQQAYIKASNTEAGDIFGSGLALSRDGATLAVAARDEDSASTGINGDQGNDLASNAGAAYVYARAGTTWMQQAYLKASNTAAGDDFGDSLTISGDGSTVIVGAVLEDSSSRGVDGNQADNASADAGAAYVFRRAGVVWTQTAYLKSSNTEAFDLFSDRVVLSSAANVVLISASDEDSAATGVNGDQSSNAAVNSGAVYALTWNGTTWNQHAYLKASNPETEDLMFAAALSSDGSVVALGAFQEDSAARGLDGDQLDNSAIDSGAVYVFSATP